MSTEAAVVFALCRCGSATCAHHKDGPCPNRMIPPVSVVHDGVTRQPVPGSESGMCQACWDNYYAELDAAATAGEAV